MKERRDSILKGFKTSGIHAKRDSGLQRDTGKEDAGKEVCKKGRMEERRDALKEGSRKGGMQEGRSNSRDKGCRKGGIQEMRDTKFGSEMVQISERKNSRHFHCANFFKFAPPRCVPTIKVCVSVAVALKMVQMPSTGVCETFCPILNLTRFTRAANYFN